VSHGAEWVAAVADEYARCAVTTAFKGRRASQVERHLSRDELATIVRTTVKDAVTRTLAQTNTREAVLAEAQETARQLAEQTEPDPMAQVLTPYVGREVHLSLRFKDLRSRVICGTLLSVGPRGGVIDDGWPISFSHTDVTDCTLEAPK
jgi:hypothetical protein